MAVENGKLEPVKPVRIEDKNLFVKINTFECYLGRVSPEACRLYRGRKASDGTVDPPIPCRTCTDWEKKAQEVYRKRLEYLKKLEEGTAMFDTALSSELLKKLEEISKVFKSMDMRLKTIEDKVTSIFEDSEGKGPLAEIFQTYLSVVIEEVVSELGNRLFEFQKEILSEINRTREELLEKVESFASSLRKENSSVIASMKEELSAKVENLVSSLRKENSSAIASVKKEILEKLNDFALLLKEVEPVSITVKTKEAEKEQPSKREKPVAVTTKKERTKKTEKERSAPTITEAEKTEKKKEQLSTMKETTPSEKEKETVLKVTSRTGKTVYKFARCVSCGKEGKIMAKGLCIKCYFTHRQAGRKSSDR